MMLTMLMMSNRVPQSPSPRCRGLRSAVCGLFLAFMETRHFGLANYAMDGEHTAEASLDAFARAQPKHNTRATVLLPARPTRAPPRPADRPAALSC